MPRFDGTGPRGQGPMTGRGLGPCRIGKSFCRNWPKEKEEQKKVLSDYKKALEEELEDVKKQEQDLA